MKSFIILMLFTTHAHAQEDLIVTLAGKIQDQLSTELSAASSEGHLQRLSREMEKVANHLQSCLIQLRDPISDANLCSELLEEAKKRDLEVSVTQDFLKLRDRRREITAYVKSRGSSGGMAFD